MDLTNKLFEELKNSRVLVTGATGLIGQTLVRKLLECGAEVVAVVRNLEKAIGLFGNDFSISYIISDVTEIEVKKYNVDFIIHAASSTSSKAFINNPVGIINMAIAI